MKTLATVALSILALNMTAAAFAENGSMRYREMVEKLREQRQTNEQMQDCLTTVDGKTHPTIKSE